MVHSLLSRNDYAFIVMQFIMSSIYTWVCIQQIIMLI